MLSRLSRFLNQYRRISAQEKVVINQAIYSRGQIASEFPADFEEEEIEIIKKVSPYTMTSVDRLVGLIRAVDYLQKNRIEGDIVECGVWRGGSMMAVCEKLMLTREAKRRLFLFDTFEGMSPPSEIDQQFDGKHATDFLLNDSSGAKSGAYWCIADLADVMKNIASTYYPESQLHFLKGRVEDTLPHPGIGPIALLRLDTDWFESTLHELEQLYDNVVSGGIIIIDDYGHWQGARKAVDTFFKSRGLSPFLNRMDYSGRLIIK